MFAKSKSNRSACCAIRSCRGDDGIVSYPLSPGYSGGKRPASFPKPESSSQLHYFRSSSIRSGVDFKRRVFAAHGARLARRETTEDHPSMTRTLGTFLLL